MLLAVGAIRLALFEMSAREELFDAITMGWQLGRKSQKLFGVRWDLLWDIPIEDVRRSLDVTAVELTNGEVSLAA